MKVKKSHEELIKRLLYTKNKYRLDWVTIAGGAKVSPRTIHNFLSGEICTTYTLCALEDWLDALDKQQKELKGCQRE